MTTNDGPEADGAEDERAVLQEMIREARAVVTRLETALGRLESGGTSEHPVVFWRKRRHMTQGELARIVGITPAALCRIEQTPGFAARPDTRARIAAALDVPLEWLQGQPEAPPVDDGRPSLDRPGRQT